MKVAQGPKIARWRVTVHIGEWTVDDDGVRSFEKARTLSFNRGETVPPSVLPFIERDDVLAEPGEDLDAPPAESEEAKLAKLRAEYDKLSTVNQVKAWLDAVPLTERGDAAAFVIGMERRGKDRLGVLRHAQQVLEVLGQEIPDVADDGPVVTGGAIRVDGNAEPGTDA